MKYYGNMHYYPSKTFIRFVDLNVGSAVRTSGRASE